MNELNSCRISDLSLILKEDLNINDLKIVNNEFEKKTRFEKFISFFTWNSTANKTQIVNRVVAIAKQLDNNTHITPDLLKKIKDIFKQKLAQIKDQNAFRSLKSQDRKFLEDFLSEEIKQLRISKLSSKRASQDVSELRIKKHVAQVKLAFELGIATSKNKGASGSVQVRNLKGNKALGIFKPTLANASLLIRIKNLLQLIVGDQLYYLSPKVDAQSKAEDAAFILDRTLKLNLVPYTRTVTFGGVEGAFQSWIHGYKEIRDYKDELDRKILTKEETTLFQMAMLFDILLGNLDRHEENWFVKVVDGKVVDIAMIDNGNSFIKMNPKRKNQLVKQYKWKELEVSKLPLLQEVKDEMLMKLENIPLFLQRVEKQLPDFLDDDMRKNFIDRAQLLQTFLQRDVVTPIQIATPVTDQDISDVLQQGFCEPLVILEDSHGG